MDNRWFDLSLADIVSILRDKDGDDGSGKQFRLDHWRKHLPLYIFSGHNQVRWLIVLCCLT